MCPRVFSKNTAFPVTVFAVALFAGFGSACDSGQVVDTSSRSQRQALFEAWTAPDSWGVSQIYFGSRDSYAQGREPMRLTTGADPKSAPAVVFAPTTGQFIVVFVSTQAPGHNEIRALVVDPSVRTSETSSVVVASPLIANIDVEQYSNASFSSPQAVWVDSKQAVFAVFNTQTAVFHAWIYPRANDVPLSSPPRALTKERHGYVSHASVAYAGTTDRLMVAWGIMRSQEDIELGVMSPNDRMLSNPSRRSWKHKQRECNRDLAPSCIEGGDRPALAFNDSLRAFGLAIADDLNDGSRVEGFLLSDTCSSDVCDITKIGNDDDSRLPESERERSLAVTDRVSSVSIAPVDEGFVIDFAYGGEGTYRSAAQGTVVFDGNGNHRRSDTL